MTQVSYVCCDGCGARLDDREQVTFVEWKPPGVERFRGDLCPECTPKLLAVFEHRRTETTP
jgi:hypothetical protein